MDEKKDVSKDFDCACFITSKCICPWNPDNLLAAAINKTMHKYKNVLEVLAKR